MILWMLLALTASAASAQSDPLAAVRFWRIENIAPGWRAKESYRVVQSGEVVETFWLAAPGKDFAVYSETHLRLVK